MDGRLSTAYSTSFGISKPPFSALLHNFYKNTTDLSCHFVPFFRISFPSSHMQLISVAILYFTRQWQFCTYSQLLYLLLIKCHLCTHNRSFMSIQCFKRTVKERVQNDNSFKLHFCTLPVACPYNQGIRLVPSL